MTTNSNNADYKTPTTPDGGIDYLQVSADFEAIQRALLRDDLDANEIARLSAHGIECTRILRRTHTGPAQAKTGKRKASAKPAINLLD